MSGQVSDNEIQHCIVSGGDLTTCFARRLHRGVMSALLPSPQMSTPQSECLVCMLKCTQTINILISFPYRPTYCINGIPCNHCVFALSVLYQCFRLKLTMTFRYNLTITLAMSHKTFISILKSPTSKPYTMHVFYAPPSATAYHKLKSKLTSWTISSSLGLCGKSSSGSECCCQQCVAVNILYRKFSAISGVV